MNWLLALAFLTPLTLAILLSVAELRTWLRPLIPWSALPALLSALFVPLGTTVAWPGVLFGVEFTLDATGQVFLLFTALLWLAASWFERGWEKGDRWAHTFEMCWLLAMAGNIGLILAADVASFYLFFAMMTFAAWGLVIHERSEAALHAGTVYIVLAILGEGMLLAGLLLAVASAGGEVALAALPAAIAEAPWQGIIVALLLGGFGIKAGMLPLHAWLPLAHPAAPVPASAVLSGVMIKAGLFGWLRFLPLGEVALPEASQAVIVLGLAGAFFGVGYGLVQHNIKAVLAYSSVSQMGVMVTILGVGLGQPALWPLLLPALSLYALHHAFTKGLLFLSVGMAMRLGPTRLILIASALAALSLAGAPLAGGALAKGAIKAPLPEDYGYLTWLLALGAAGTTLLMLRFMQLLRAKPLPTTPQAEGLWGGWGLALLACLFGPWLAALWLLEVTISIKLWAALWPLLLGAALAWLLLRRALPNWPAGDIAESCSKGLKHLHQHSPRPELPQHWWQQLGHRLQQLHRRATAQDMMDSLSGLALLLVALMLYLGLGGWWNGG